MSNKQKMIAAGAGVVVIALGAFLVLSGKASDLPIPGIQEEAMCPLSGREPRSEALVERPAVAVKIENVAAARPLAGLDRADLVYEEPVEGGLTRFMAIFHCRDTSRAGPVRSARLVDPAIMGPVTRILAFSGANQPVLDALSEEGVVQVTEISAGVAMQRIERAGVSSEHTLYADIPAVRKIGGKKYEDTPPDDMFEFGDLEGRAKKARTVTLDFGGASTITYDWSGTAWERSQDGEPFVLESGSQVAVPNVVIEQHKVDFSKTIVDPAGNPSVEIRDETGSGRAILFRDGKAIEGRWARESVDDAVVFETKDGETFVFAPGAIWIELVPNDDGEVKGSVTYGR